MNYCLLVRQSVDEPDRSAQLEMLDKNRIDVFQKQSRGDGNLLFQNPVTEEEYIRRKYSLVPVLIAAK